MRAARGQAANGEQLAAKGSAPAPHSSPANGQQLTANGCSGSAGVLAYRAKVAAQERRVAENQKPPRRKVDIPIYRDLYSIGDWPLRTMSCDEFVRQEQEQERLEAAELEVIKGLHWSMPWEIAAPLPGYLKRDDHDGYFLARHEVGPDLYEYDPPPIHGRRSLWGRKLKRWLTARERLMKVKPSVRILPLGPRSCELVVTRRFHEVQSGLKEALELARMIEGAIKRRDPIDPWRQPTWRQQFRDHILNDYRSLLTFLVRCPITQIDRGKWTRNAMDNGKWRMDNAGGKVLYLGPADREAVLYAGRPRPHLTELFPDAALPQRYLELVAHQWLTEDLELFAATPGGDFTTAIAGYRLQLPQAVMPPATYERWLARGGDKPRKRRRRKRPRPQGGGSAHGSRPSRLRALSRRRSRRACTCFQPRPIFRTLAPWSTPENPFFLRN